MLSLAGTALFILAIAMAFLKIIIPQAYVALFDSVVQSTSLNIWWHSVLMGVTILVVLRGIRGGIERFGQLGHVGFVAIVSRTWYLCYD